MAPGPGRVQISFPRHSAALLDSLNRLRLQGKFCDVAVLAGGRVFAAHRSVLAAASPFFHDKLLLQDTARLALPPAIDAGAFEGLLELIYCGRLSVAAEALPGHLLVASGLQMWHVVERCSQVLRQLEGGASGRRGRDGDGDGAGRGPEGSSVSAWDGHGGDEAIRGLDGSVHALDGCPSSSSSSSKAIHGHDGLIHGLDGSIHGHDGSIHALDGSIHGLDGCPSSSSSSKAIHGLDGSLSSSSSSLSSSRGVRGREGFSSSSSSSSRAVHGHKGSSLSSSRTTRGPAGSSRASRGGEGPSSSSSSSSPWTLHGGSAVVVQLSRGGEGPSSSSSSRGSHGGQGNVHGDSGPGHGDEGPSSSSSSSSWAARAGTEELLRLRVAGGASPAEEILKIRVDDDDNDDDRDEDHDDHGEDEGPVRVVLDDTTNAAVPEPFHIKAEPDAAAAAPPPSEVAMAAGWRPVDLHGNELPGRGAGPLHAPVRLGTAPADGKRFGCACGKRFAVRPKRDRHILLTLSLRPFACGACHKRFKLKHHLTEHMKTHDGARRGCGRARHRPGPPQHRPGPPQHRPGPGQHRPGPATRWAGTCWACE